MPVVLNGAPGSPAAREPLDVNALRAELQDHRVTVRKPDLATLKKNAVHVRLSVKYWRAKERLTLADVGLETAPEEFQTMAAEYLHLGHMKLLPKRLLDRLHTLEERGRQSCLKFGIKSPWGGFMILFHRYPEWRETVEKLQAEFYTLAEQIVNERDDWLNQVLAEYRKKELVALARERGIDTQFAEAALDLTEIDTRIARIRGMIPAAEVIEDKFFFDWVPEVLERPDFSDEVDVAELERRAQHAKNELAQLEETFNRRKQALDESLDYQKQRQELAANAERLRIETEIAREMQTKGNEIRGRELEDLFKDFAAHVRVQMAALARSVLGTVDEKSRVFPQQLVALRALVKEVRNFNIMEDAELENVASQVELVCKEKGGVADVDLDDLRALMEDVWNYARTGLQSLGRFDRLAAPEKEDLLKYHAPAPQEKLRRAFERFGDDLDLAELMPAAGASAGRRL